MPEQQVVPKLSVENLRDEVALAQALIRCPSVTPEEGGALALLQKALEQLGFDCERQIYQTKDSYPVDNLFAKRGGGRGPVLAYAGHSDVVPPGRLEDWSVPPFAAEILEDRLIGRGAADMKGSIAAFIAALARYMDERENHFDGDMIFVVTGDEEAKAIDGTKRVLEWMESQGHRVDHCLVGEPTSNDQLGDMVKIGRRGSINFELTVKGIQGHTAYPQMAQNPIHPLVAMLHNITTEPLDHGTEHFPPSSLQVVTVDVGNPATNVIPASAFAGFNVRFNDLYSSDRVIAWVKERLNRAAEEYDVSWDLNWRISGESFLSPPGLLSELLCASIKKVTGRDAALGTSGGTSDARFIRRYASVAEFGLRNATAHKVDESCQLDELRQLSAIYQEFIAGYFDRAVEGKRQG